METAALAAADLDPDYVTDGSQVLKRKTTASSGVDEVSSRPPRELIRPSFSPARCGGSRSGRAPLALFARCL
eukprot:COSAG02_NODE_2845_length_7905_cov_15.063413_2_plen_72_part_00